LLITTEKNPRLLVKYPPSDRRQKDEEEIDVAEFIAVKSHKARGKRVSATKIKEMHWLEPYPDETETGSEPEPEALQEKTSEPETKALFSDHVLESDKSQKEGTEPVDKNTSKSRTGDKERQIRLDLDI